MPIYLPNCARVTKDYTQQIPEFNIATAGEFVTISRLDRKQENLVITNSYGFHLSFPIRNLEPVLLEKEAKSSFAKNPIIRFDAKGTVELTKTIIILHDDNKPYRWAKGDRLKLLGFIYGRCVTCKGLHYLIDMEAGKDDAFIISPSAAEIISSI